MFDNSITAGFLVALMSWTALSNDGFAAGATEKIITGTVASISDAGVYIGIAKGYYKDEGLELEPGVFDSGSNQIGLLAAGKIDVAGGTPAAGTFNAVAQGINLKIVADKGTHTPGHGYIAFLLRKDLSSKIARLEDLKKLEKPRLSVPATGGIGAEAQVRSFLKKAGLDEKNVELKIVPYPQVPAALAGNGLDVGTTLEPYATKAIEQGIGTNLMWVDELRPNDIGGVLMYSEKFIKERPQVARNFMVAYLKAIRYYLSAFQGKDAALRKDVIGSLAKNTAVKEPELYEKMRVPGFDANGRANLASLKTLFSEFVSMGYIQNPEKIKVESIVDNSFVDYAVQKLGPVKK